MMSQGRYRMALGKDRLHVGGVMRPGQARLGLTGHRAALRNPRVDLLR